MKLNSMVMLLGTVSILSACSSTNTSSVSHAHESIKQASAICLKWKEQSVLCEKFNRDYQGIERINKIAACMKARGFPLHKAQYCH